MKISRDCRVSGLRRVHLVASSLLVAGILGGCAGSQLGSHLLGGSAEPVDRQALTEQIFQTCRRATTPWLSRPTSPMSGKCECAAVSFHNYATDAEVEDVRTLWALYGSGKEFTHKVLGVTENFHTTHCAQGQDSMTVLARTRLDEGNGLEAEKQPVVDTSLASEQLATVAPEMTTDSAVVVTTEPNITRFALSPSALKDKDLVRYIQRKLKGLGYNPGPLDGVLGKRTRSALNAYAEAKNMPAGTSAEDIMSSLLF